MCRMMVDADETAELTFDQLLAIVGECKRIEQQVRDHSDAEAAELLSSVAVDVQQRTLELGKLFRGKGKANETGVLPFKDVVRF
jgi:hypothetical protein